MSMLPTTQIEVRQETAQLLIEKAAMHKLSLDEYLRTMAERDNPPPVKTLDEILASFRAEAEAQGYSEDDLDELFTEARKEVFQDKQGQATTSGAPSAAGLSPQELAALEAQVQAQGHKFYGIFADDPGALAVFDEIEQLRNQQPLANLTVSSSS
jgi:hypothetical protein